jgi:hypothetical protein
VYFPYDKQKCRLRFGSWVYDDRFIDVNNYSERGDISSYQNSNEWILEDFSVERSQWTRPSNNKTFPYVSFYIRLQRHPFHYHLNLLLPCLLIHMIGVFMFFLPPDSGERMSYGVTALLSMVVFSTNMSNSLQATNFAIPYISKWCQLGIQNPIQILVDKLITN